MVGGTIPPQSDSGEISRVLVLNLLWRTPSTGHYPPKHHDRLSSPKSPVHSAQEAFLSFSATARYAKDAGHGYPPFKSRKAQIQLMP